MDNGKIVLSLVCLVGFLLGLLLEHKADMELKRFRELHGPGNLKTDGMFSVTRHPNHLGEAILGGPSVDLQSSLEEAMHCPPSLGQ